MAKKKNTTQITNWTEVNRAMEEEAEADRSEHIWRVITSAASVGKSEHQERWLKAIFQSQAEEQQEEAAREGL